MNLELSKMRDLSNEIEELRSQAKRYNKEELIEKKNKIKQLALSHRDDGSASLEEVNKAIADIEGIDKDIAKAEEISKDIEKKEKELNEMRDKYSHLNTKITGGEFKRNMNGETEKVDIRRAFAKKILTESARKFGISGVNISAFALTEAEERALGVATTTTSLEFVQPNEAIDGINNGGLFIPTSVVYELLRDDEIVSTIYNDMNFTAIAGNIQFPYLVQKSAAKKKGELEESEDLSFEWSMITGKTGTYTATVAVTFEVEKMTPDSFIDYLVSLLKEAVREVMGIDLIYGKGEENSVYGITHNAIQYEYSADTKIMEVIEVATSKIPKRKRAGAKIYMATDIYDAFIRTKNSNGDYMLPVLNYGETKITFLGREVLEDQLLIDGEFLIGNVKKNYKPNMIANMELTLDTTGKKRLKEYSAHAMMSAVPAPSSFIHGKKQATRSK